MLKSLLLFALLNTLLLSKGVIEMNFTRDKNDTNRSKKIDFIFKGEERKREKNRSVKPKTPQKLDSNSSQKDTNTTKKPQPKIEDKNSTKTVKEQEKPKESNITLSPQKLQTPQKLDSNQTQKPKEQKSIKKRKPQPKTEKKRVSKRVKKPKKIEKFKRNGRAGVIVIIIDDISSRSQIKKIKSLPFKVTPSIFPPSNMSERTPKLVRGLGKHFMIHLPMQSHSAKMNRFRKTLMVHDSRAKIRRRVQEMRRLFPSAVFINNHTGSTFTASYRASKILYQELINRGFIFVDSKTSGRTKMRKISRELGRAYIGRDIFLDNTQNVSSILRQLKKAVRIAKRRGFAIVIGHPHKSTFRALRRAKHLLKGVKPLYIDEFYRWRFR